MYSLVKNFFSLLSKDQKKRFFIMQILVVLSAFAEIISIASIVPFMTLVSDIDSINENSFIGSIYKISGFNTEINFVFAAGVSVLIILLVSSVISIVTTWRLSMYAAKVGAEIADRLYIYYMYQNWLFHSSQNSSELTKKVVNETMRITNGILTPIMMMNARIVLSFLMIFMLVLYNPIVAIVGFLVFGIAYYALFKFVRARLHNNGRILSIIYGKRYLLLNEGFGGIKDIILYGRSKNFTDRFQETGKKLYRSQGNNHALALMPRYIIELLAFGMIILLTLYLILNYQGELGEVLPLLSVYAVAAIKILPAFQQIYTGFANLKANLPAFESIRDDLEKSQNADYSKYDNNKDILELKNKISLKNISFAYPEKKHNALNDINISIPVNSVIGIVGPSGSGKSTLIDIILGLIRPATGEVLIDEKSIDHTNLRLWQNNIGFVPQSIFLTEGDLIDNIAFGIEKEKVDINKIDEAIKLAHMDEFIKTLESGVNTEVGERGIKLSGGQRQRIGIARALYQKREILLFDEATSSLDGISEKKIMEAIDSLIGKKTIILVAHRLKTVEKCDKIFFIDNGSVVDTGTYIELKKNNHLFRKMTENS